MSNSLKYKNKYTRILVSITGINMVLLIAMLLFCYWNLDMSGTCEECMASDMASTMMIYGIINNIILIVLVVGMRSALEDFKDYEGNRAFPILSGVTMILSGIHMFLFWELKARGHGEIGIEMIMLDAQFMIARVVSAILIFLNIVLLIFVKLWYYEEKKSYNG